MRSTKFQSVEGSEVRTPFMSIPSYMRLAYRTSEDRTVINSAKQIYVHIDLGGVAQASRTQLDVFKSIAVGAQRGVIVDSAECRNMRAGSQKL